jgi:hypothetical protein
MSGVVLHQVERSRVRRRLIPVSIVIYRPILTNRRHPELGLLIQKASSMEIGDLCKELVAATAALCF